jgi:hypothetical protein
MNDPLMESPTMYGVHGSRVARLIYKQYQSSALLQGYQWCLCMTRDIPMFCYQILKLPLCCSLEVTQMFLAIAVLASWVQEMQHNVASISPAS